MLRELPIGQLRGICWPASVGGSSWVWMGALWSPWTTLALLPLPFLKWSWPNFTLAYEFPPKDLNLPLQEVQWSKKDSSFSQCFPRRDAVGS